MPGNVWEIGVGRDLLHGVNDEMMHIPMLDLKAEHSSIQEEIDVAVQRVFESGQFVLGPEVEGFERDIAAYCGATFAIGVASGTDALILGLMACGVRQGDEVIVPPFTFMATAEAVSRCGASPVFVDIDPVSCNIDASLIEAAITNRTRAIVPVHLYGQPADMQAILDLARGHGLKIVEDCAQALSAEWRGRKVGSIGDAGCLSFYPSKNLGGCGDGGMVVTSDPQIADSVRMLRQHGSRMSYHHSLIGFNSRLDAIQSAILKAKLRHLDAWSDLRRKKAALYTRLLNDVEGVRTLCVPKLATSSANYYTIRLVSHRKTRDGLRRYLTANGIDTAVYYPLSLHLQEAYQDLGYKPGDFPNAELAQEQVLSLPLFPQIGDEEVTAVAGKIEDFLGD
jgi:dTDP-4-amino-4,6-dideoxygalactose transaminase